MQLHGVGRHAARRGCVNAHVAIGPEHLHDVSCAQSVALVTLEEACAPQVQPGISTQRSALKGDLRKQVSIEAVIVRRTEGCASDDLEIASIPQVREAMLNALNDDNDHESLRRDIVQRR